MATTTSLRLLNLLPNPHHHSKLPQPPPPHIPTSSGRPLSQLQHAKTTTTTTTTTTTISPLSIATAAAAAFFLESQDALAAGGEFGILEGRTLALIHPAIMGGLFVYTLWSGYLGWQWRRVRTIQDEINELKKQVKPAVPAAVPAGAVVPPESTTPPTLSPVELKIQQLTEERKKLLKGSYKDRHFNAGSILLGFGVFESVGGGLNTWLRTGKLFPGPHLFAGAGFIHQISFY